MKIPSQQGLNWAPSLPRGQPCAQDAVGGTALHGVLGLTEGDRGAGTMVMAESQGLATVSLCLPPGGPQTHVEGGKGWRGDICDPYAHHHHLPKPDPCWLGMVTTVSPLPTDRPPHAAALRGRGEGDDGETPAEAR